MEERNMATGTYEIIYDESDNIKDITVTGLTEDYKFTECIVSAVENTYQQGVNPKAVPELIRLLKDLNLFLRQFIESGVGNTESVRDLDKNVEQALKKAEL